MKNIMMSLFATTVLLAGCKMEDSKTENTQPPETQETEKTTPDQDTRTNH
jgi:PBP1b-binding outer membrane lipoprotein LpoB